MEIEIETTLLISHELPDLPDDDPCRPRHEHDLTVRFAIRGSRTREGWLMTFGHMLEIWNEYVDVVFGGADANKLIEQPTLENIACAIAVRLERPFSMRAVALVRVEVVEELPGGARGTARWSL